MNQLSSRARWGIGIGAILLLGLLFYGLGTEQPPQQERMAGQATTPAPPPQTAPKTTQTTPDAQASKDSQVTKDAQANKDAQATKDDQATKDAQATKRDTSERSTTATNLDVTPKQPAEAAQLPNFVDLVQTVKPAVVSIRVKSDLTPQITRDDGMSPFEGTPFERFFGSPDQDQQRAPKRPFYTQGQGSGFFISADGYVVTNNHVIRNAVKVDVVTDDGSVLNGKVVGTDPKTDLALIKVDGNGNKFHFVNFADEPAKIGEWVIAMGNPFGLGGTVTSGIVSAKGRDIGTGPYDDFLQIDAAVNRGNSGGPTFNMAGRIVGVNTAIFSPSGGSIGIAFSVPASIAKPVVAQLKERGYVERGWIGVQVQPVSKEIAESLGMKEAAGALISGTQQGSPAAKAGLKVGDVVTSINGDSIEDSRDLARTIAAIAPNTKVKVEYMRDGKTQTAQVTLGQLRDNTARKASAPQGSGRSEQTSSLGISVAPAARVMGIGEQGLAVLRVDPNGKAAEVGLTAGDVILKVGQREMQSPQDLVAALDEAAKQNKEHVLTLIRRNDRELFITLPATAG